MPPSHSHSHLMPSSASLKRRRAASAPCEDDMMRNTKRSRSDVDRLLTTKPLRMPEIYEQEEEGFTGDVEKVDKGKAKQVFPVAGCLATSEATVSTKSAIEELALLLCSMGPGTNCPACRGISTSVIPSRVVQAMIDLLLRLDPSKARIANERLQADKLPTPRPKSPEPNLETPGDNMARPCPTCLPGNPYGWRCPVPIQDPIANPEQAFDLDDGIPPGHAFCGNCDQLHNVEAPSTTKCDFCQVSFCGIEIQTRCCALGLLSQQPHGISDIPDIILNGAIYERFNENTVEVDIMLDYLRSNNVSLRSVYRDIVSHIIKQPHGFAALIDSGAFDDMHNVSGGEDPDPTAPRRRICRLCAAQVLIYGLKGWWIRERKKAVSSGNLPAREDCPQGGNCNRQADLINHTISDPYDALLADGEHIASASSSGLFTTTTTTTNGSAGASHDQSHGGVIVPHTIPFSILMPFPIIQPNSEGMGANISPPPSSGMNPLEQDVDIVQGNIVAVEDGEVNGSSGGSTVAAEIGPQEVLSMVNNSEDLGQNNTHPPSRSPVFSPYISPDISVPGSSEDIGGTMISSSSFLSPVFPTST
ncbi:hypothetical protein Clacol_007539 [Clathrus columnatus]|uniref:E3 ubiquitin-protein ligase CHFR cysteine rich domain-containing protein n=1 Tax=Clathrus columnatus TaxID=1419009 RepID=A0AAV5AHZ2_9AGAM|nr:hypothetical protein Clacol_007539 [Clathrus columnatus]